MHTAGPYQGRDHRIAQACFATGCHDVDPADGRDFVAEFDRGGLLMRLAGTGFNGRPLVVEWRLTTLDSRGPEIPCTPAGVIVLLGRMVYKPWMHSNG